MRMEIFTVQQLKMQKLAMTQPLFFAQGLAEIPRYFCFEEFQDVFRVYFKNSKYTIEWKKIKIYGVYSTSFARLFLWAILDAISVLLGTIIARFFLILTGLFL